MPCLLTETRRADAGPWIPTGRRPSATACSPSPLRCSSWTSRFIRRDHRCSRYFMLARLCGLRRQLPDHRRCVARPHRIDRPARAVRSDLPAINLLVLLVAAFLPFPTWLVADALHEVGAERVAVTIYGLTMLAIRLLGSALGGICTARAPLLPAGETARVAEPATKTAARRDRVCDRDPDRARRAGSGGGVVLRYNGVPDCAVPAGRTAAGPAPVTPARARLHVRLARGDHGGSDGHCFNRYMAFELLRIRTVVRGRAAACRLHSSSWALPSCSGGCVRPPFRGVARCARRWR